MKFKNITRNIVIISTLLVISGVIMLNHGIAVNSEFWKNLAPELFGGGILIVALFFFGKATRMIK